MTDWMIRKLGDKGMISPFVGDTKKRTNKKGVSVPSYGVSSYGYDVRLGDKFLFPSPRKGIDPMGGNEWVEVKVSGDRLWLPKNTFCLAHTMEVIEVPRHCICTVVGKSTYARCGIAMTMTPLEPGWKGQITLEIANLTNEHVALYIGGGIAQIIYHLGEEEPDDDYGDGLYHETMGVVPSGRGCVVKEYITESGFVDKRWWEQSWDKQG